MDEKPLEEWSNEEIREALLAHGEDIPVTSTTKSLCIQKLRKYKAHASREGNGVEEAPQQPSQDGDDCNSQTEKGTPLGADKNTIEGYYGVSARCDDPKSLDLAPFYTNYAEVRSIIKKFPSVRFKKFDTREGAEAFSQQELEHEHPNTTTTDSKSNNFPSLKTQDLTKLRKLIECNDVATFVDTVWSNPRYLISSGDAPTILHEGFCYNALHCAVKGGSVEMCRKLFSILESDEFWEMVYPDDSQEVRAERRRHLIDLYLNIQDSRVPRPGKKVPVQNNETPLHFACKLGHEDIVSFLVSFPQTSTEVKNSFGETPADVTCKNATHSSPMLRERILQLLKAPEVYYVPVLRAVDNSAPPQLGSPCTSEEYTQQQSAVTGSPHIPITGQAFAGPMSPTKAKEFYREWRSPSSERREASNIKRTDPNRGWERIGRQIARQRGIGWTEYWDFLGCFCDLSSPEGMQRLEEYLAGQLETTEVDQTTEAMASLNISSPERPSPRATSSSFVTPVKSGWLRHDAVDTPDFLTGPVPTKLDSDVLLALPVDGVDPKQFPHVHQWVKLVKSYPELERKSWRTPASIHRHRSSCRSLPISPLVFHSPTHHPPSRGHSQRPHLPLFLSARKTMEFET